MTRIYIVRHCETDGNAMKIFQGHTDLDINKLGARQLDALSDKFKNIALDRVFTSPLLRARKTAEAIVGHRNIPIFQDEGLIELNGGVYEGKTYTQIGEEYPDFKEIWNYRPWDFAPIDGEKMTDGYNRIWQCIKKIAQNNTGKTLAVVTHGGVIRCLLCKILKDDTSKLCEIPFVGNTGVTLLEFDEKMTPEIIFINDLTHLTEELKNKNAKVPLGVDK